MLSDLLKRRRPGTWLVLNPEMTKVLGAGPTPERAARRAGISQMMVPASEDLGYEQRPVMIQVPSPRPYY